MGHLDLDTAPTVDPISTVEAKSHLRVDVSDDDALIDGYAAAAREHAEAYTRRALLTQTWDLVLDRFPTDDVILLPKPPLQSVSAIGYIDVNGVSQTWNSSLYDVDAPSGERAVRGRISPAFGEVWPTARSQLNAVTITFVAGYGNAATDVPKAIIQAMLLLLGHWYDHREAVAHAQTVVEVPVGVNALLWPYRAMSF